jgi:hypothetical protein
MTSPAVALGLILLLAPAFAEASAGRPSPQEAGRGPGEVRKNLERILASPEYGIDRPTPDAKESIWRWISRKIGELFDAITNLGGLAPPVFWSILTVLLVILAAILVHGGVIVLRALRASRARAGPAPRKGARGEDADALLARAAAAAASGQFTEAIRLCHRAALMALDRRGFVRFQECLTSGDYRGQLRSHEAERAIFSELTRIYEPAYFGKAAAGGADYEESLRLARRLTRETAP